MFDGDLGSMGQWSSYAFAGTRQKGYYAQISGTIVDQDHFDMSGRLHAVVPTCTRHDLPGFPYEDGGNRDHSDSEDWRINTKVGITPNATDEYSINYTTQANNRGSPIHTNRQIVQGYNFGSHRAALDVGRLVISTLSWMSKTQLGDASYIKTNAYWNTFGTTSSSTTIAPTRAFSSIASTTTTAWRFRGDGHRAHSHEHPQGRHPLPSGRPQGMGPRLRPHSHHRPDCLYREVTDGTSREETWSFAVENTFHATRNLDFVAGISYDTNQVLRADFAESTHDPSIAAGEARGRCLELAGGGHLDYSRTGTAHASVSSRTRFPTLFERYSTRFGTRSVDPNLDPERATNYELGASDLFGDVKVSGALFYSDIKDNIQNAFYAANGMNSIIGFNADGESYGLELSADWDVSRTLRVGGNYTYIERDFDYARCGARNHSLSRESPQATAAISAYQPEGTPAHKAFLYASWQATRQLTLTPSLELSSDRTVLITDCRTTLTSTGANPRQPRCRPLEDARVRPDGLQARPGRTSPTLAPTRC